MKIIRIFSMVGSAAVAQAAYAETVGTVLFAQEGAQIVSASGTVRPARRGDAIQAGEQLTTTNGISQVKLSDGSLVGVRPGSQLLIETPGSVMSSGQSMSLLRGGVRIIGAELTNRREPSNVTLRTGQAVLNLTGADLESMVVHQPGRPDGGDGRPERTGEPQPPRGGDPGSYNRLITGTGNLRSGNATEPLVARQVSFVPAGNPVPMQLAAMPAPAFQDRPPVPGGPANPPPGGVQGDGPKPPPPGASPPGMPAGARPPALSPMTSTLTAPQVGAGPQVGPGGPPLGMPPPPPGPGPGPVFSPIATAAFPDGPKGPAPTMPAMAPGGPGMPGNMKPMGPPVNLRPPPICTPSPIAGKPPICK